MIEFIHESGWNGLDGLTPQLVAVVELTEEVGGMEYMVTTGDTSG